MKWSITKSKMFSQCQRKWYYSEIVASHKSKDPLRREAYLLKQLQSLNAWRGSIVDKVIEKYIVPRIRTRNLPSENEVIGFCSSLINSQIAFGKAGKHRHLNVTKSNGNDAYCAFYDLEYNGGLNEKKLEEARDEAILSLRNLMRSGFLKKIMMENCRVIAQRPLVFELEKFKVSCTPDLLAFSMNAPPLIVDWKVHTFGNADSWLQLGVYALALSRTNVHKDFPDGIKDRLKDATSIRLIEYQLLKNKQREYSISQDDICDIEDYIFRSCSEISDLVNGKKYDALDASQFQTARSPTVCERCQFKTLCWKKILATRQTVLFGDVWT